MTFLITDRLSADEAPSHSTPGISGLRRPGLKQRG
jgi:hypothetical protein